MATKTFDIGDTVVCDDCSKQYTAQSPEQGGMLFGSRGICPECTPRWEKTIARYNEEHFIRDRARPGETYHAAVMRWRNGNNVVRISGGDDFVEEMEGILRDGGVLK